MSEENSPQDAEGMAEEKEEEKFACSHCEKEFNSARGLASHEAQVHPEKMVEDDEEEEEEEEETSQNSGKTVLYCHVRDAMEKKDLVSIKDALEEEGYELVPAESGGHVMVQKSSTSEDDLQSLLG